jgi:hypothetical protein
MALFTDEIQQNGLPAHRSLADDARLVDLELQLAKMFGNASKPDASSDHGFEL